MLDVTVVMTTWFPEGDDGNKRLSIAKGALGTWEHFLFNHVGRIYLHIADDGSDIVHLDSLMETCQKFHPTLSVQQRHGVGASLNTGFRKAFEKSDFVLYAVDDWKLNYECDLTPWINLLDEDESIGCIRLGPPHPDLTGMIQHDNNRWYIRLDRHHFAFSFRPTLFHRRMIDKYGRFDEDVNSYDAEQMYNERFNKVSAGMNYQLSRNRPDIIYALPYPWDHIYGVELAGVNPREN